jgi:penicillin-binding protein 1A
MIQPRPLPWGVPPRPISILKPHVRVRPAAIPNRRKLIKTILASIVLAILSVAALGMLALTVLLLRVRPTLPSVAQISAFQPASATRIYSSDGVLLATLQAENRRPVQLHDIAPKLIDATLAAEDNRFYEHSGVDLRGIGRAVLANLTSRDMSAQGASTITQQLARNVSAFGISKQKTVTRKLREALTAERIEQVFDKDTILELYLNQIYYGSGAYGVEAASRTYFGKPASKLDLAEAALLAGLPQRPLAYSPYSHPKQARERRDVVLKRMLDTGRITVGAYERATSEPVNLAGRQDNRTVYRAPYFVDWVVQNVVKQYGADAVYSGWKVVTTLDWRMQEKAERAVRRGLRDGATQGALVAIDPHTGEVRAMVGGVDYKKDRFNAITQGKRQPGSAFKPIVYAAAFDGSSLSLYSEMKDEKLDIPNGAHTWTVHNYDGGYRNRDVTMLEAIASSINTVAVQTAQETGIPRIIYTAQRMGITTDLAPYLPLALGASAVRPIELCSAYGVFAAEGSRYQPTGIRTVEDANGGFVVNDDAVARRTASCLDSGTVEQMNVALRAVVTQGTGGAAISVPHAFGKTGTTNDGRDAWFVGYTPELVTAVWVANPHRDAHGITRYAVMPGATGGHVATPIWADFMRQAVSVQKDANRRRHQPQWAINLPPPPKQEKEIALDEGTERYLNQPAPQQTYNSPAQQWDTNSAAAPAPDEGLVEHASASVPIYRASGGGQATTQLSSMEDGGADTVRVCAETGKLATEWCESTMLLRATGRNVPTTYCRKHHAPFGEPAN